MPITIKIDVRKIDKSRLFEGKKGKYLNALLVETPTSKYSDYMILQEQTKEERERKEKGIILGNARILDRKNGRSTAKQQNEKDEDW